MTVLMRAGQDILRAEGHRNSGVYRGILELLSRFGYLSIQEVMYGFQLRTQEAINRLFYLEKSGFIGRFPSLASPDFFFCLTPLGRQAVTTYGICDYVQPFYPSRYTPSNQNHHRALVRIYSAMKRLLGADLCDWRTEARLKQEAGENNGIRRILDGEFTVAVRKQKYADVDGSLKFVEETSEKWKCGLELELTLKSAGRYEKQFLMLSRKLYDPFHREGLPLILFLAAGGDIYERLTTLAAEKSKIRPYCVFLLGWADRFLDSLGNAPLMKFVSGARKEILAKDLNRIRVQVDQ